MRSRLSRSVVVEKEMPGKPGRCGAASARRGGAGRLALDPSTEFTLSLSKGLG